MPEPQATRPFSRLYHILADEYPEVYDSPLLADYMRLLAASDQAYPTRPLWAGHTTRANLNRLATIGADDGRGALVIVTGTRFSIKGHAKDREERSERARRNALARYTREQQQGRGRATAEPQQSDSTARTEQYSTGQNSREENSTNGRARDWIDPQREGLPHLTAEAQQALTEASGLIVSTASDKVLTDLDDIVEHHGVESVAGVMGRLKANGKGRTWPQLVYGARNRLDPIPGHEDEKAEDERERAEAEKRRWAKSAEENRRRREELGLS